ncbi:MAG: hypothetical protein KJ558_10120 [Gammaproteobacteria bacterium]|nr:hypothetical protein [Gammaproteobacteria bacterium]MBU1655162.1 hypothetical protein [Gammaproteobacteria bacterium]MBU1959973.1 hypothetical protein [Gammaproteobacteria bacterium]
MNKNLQLLKLATTEDGTVSMRLLLQMEVTYHLNGETPEKAKAMLQDAAAFAYEEGLLSGETALEVERFETSVREFPFVSETEVAAFQAWRLENGDLDPEDIPVRLARYGLMSPAEFAVEMQERMAKEEERNHRCPRCPDTTRNTGDLVGCGSSNVSGPDEEGLYDCGDCGLFFRADTDSPGQG